MFRRFLKDKRGNFAMLTAIAIVPILGGLALSIDYVQMSRQKQDTLNALDAAGMATARKILEGASDAEVRKYAREFFDANLSSVHPRDAVLTVNLPANTGGGGKVKLIADLTYHPLFLPPFIALLNGADADQDDRLRIHAESEIQLKNTVEVALVLDNSGSMDYTGSGSNQKRIDLLKTASKELVEKLAATASLMKQIQKPVQFSVVPFAASVNIGPANGSESWMDREGLSSIHHENFDWSTVNSSNKKISKDSQGRYYKDGTGWGGQRNQIVSRFTLFDDLKRCTDKNCTSVQAAASWKGCVETRPSPYNTNDEAPNSGRPDTLFVPMFAPDEAGDFDYGSSSKDNLVDFYAYNTWWNDGWGNAVNNAANAKSRQRNALKYFSLLPSSAPKPSEDQGPNASCTTTAITPLTDVTLPAGMAVVKDAIDAMEPTGATNVPEGLAWGWRTLSSQAPFTGGRPETERGNDKVVIVLTDGANTYYEPTTLGIPGRGNTRARDTAENKSIYSTYGYARLNNGNPGRIFQGTSVSPGYNNATYTTAMNAQFLKTCENANGGDTGGKGAGLIIMTVALDLNAKDQEDSAQLAMMKKCASRSRYARDPDDVTKGKKLFWNTSGKDLQQTFKEIADELSNLRFVG